MVPTVLSTTVQNLVLCVAPAHWYHPFPLCQCSRQGESHRVDVYLGTSQRPLPTTLHSSFDTIRSNQFVGVVRCSMQSLTNRTTVVYLRFGRFCASPGARCQPFFIARVTTHTVESSFMFCLMRPLINRTTMVYVRYFLCRGQRGRQQQAGQRQREATPPGACACVSRCSRPDANVHVLYKVKHPPALSFSELDKHVWVLSIAVSEKA